VPRLPARLARHAEGVRSHTGAQGSTARPAPGHSLSSLLLLLLLPSLQAANAWSRTFCCFMQGVALLQQGAIGEARSMFVQVRDRSIPPNLNAVPSTFRLVACLSSLPAAAAATAGAVHVRLWAPAG